MMIVFIYLFKLIEKVSQLECGYYIVHLLQNPVFYMNFQTAKVGLCCLVYATAAEGGGETDSLCVK